MLRKSLCFIAVILCLLSLAGCGADKPAVKIDGEGVPQGVYDYFYDEVSDSADNAKQETEKLCRNYIATSRLMKQEGITLSTNHKRQIADETEKVWSIFSAYYESIGITKQDITAIKTWEYSKKELLNFYYGTGGRGEVSQEKLRERFAQTYVGFRAVEASFTKLSDMGESIEMADSEKKELRSTFKNMAEKVSAGVDIDSVNESYNEGMGLIVTGTLNLTVIKESDPVYGEAFFAQVKELSYGKAAVIESGSNIYMLQRVRVDNDDETFSLYAAEVLEDMKMASVEKKIEKLAGSFE